MFLESLFSPKENLYFASTEPHRAAFQNLLVKRGKHREAFEKSFGAKIKKSKSGAMMVTCHPDRREHVVVGYNHLCDVFKRQAEHIDTYDISYTGTTIEYVDMTWNINGAPQEDRRKLAQKWADHAEWKKDFDKGLAEIMVANLTDFLAQQAADQAAREAKKPRIQKFFEKLLK